MSDLDLSSLENSIANLSLDPNTSEMAKFDLKILDIVPKFEGESNELSAFLEICQTLIKTYWETTTPNSTQNILLINGIYSKLIGRARSIYCNCISKDWENVKKTLIAHFGDQRNESGLLMDLGNLRQTPNEPSLQFLTRVMNLLNALHNYIDLHETIPEVRHLKKSFYQEHALNILLAGLRDPQGPMIRSMKPKSLAEAQQCIITDNNIRYQQRHTRPDNFQPNPIRKTFKPHNTHNIQQPNSNHNNNTQNFRPFIPQATRQFPNAPINVQPIRQNNPPKYFTNNQVFGPKPNVFKPKNNSHLLPKPTPMSGISTATSNNNRFQYRPQQNFQRPQPMIEELFNLENDEQPSCYYEDPMPSTSQYYPEDHEAYSNYENENYNTTSDPQQEDVNPNETFDLNFHEITPPNETT